MKRGTKIALSVVGVVTIGGSVVMARLLGSDGSSEIRTVAVVRDSIVKKALAVGNIEPDVEIEVKSQVGGVIGRLMVEEGDYVEAGQPILEVTPNPTPIELAEAKRQVELREIDLENELRGFERKKELRERDFITQEELEDSERDYNQSRVQVQMTRERVALFETGRVRIDNRNIEGVIRSPINGFVLEMLVEQGDPVVPLSNFQEGTVLATMAEMSDLIFRGTVDEIDVGRLNEGMPATIKIGALPQARIEGEVYSISLKARKEDNATVFPIEITLVESQGVALRAGYSANADVIIERRDSILVIPERLIRVVGDTTKVTVLGEGGVTEERIIRTGLSDAVSIEVLEGLEEGEKLVEPPPREIS
ncbi:MAG: efflux RND transporter periplasmic adaptor subunit [Gemmatimonadales bacterium]|nr:MAG: efflux RND transporter periplasmic adaptor subunit [Gemmatimonadales bacterium]